MKYLFTTRYAGKSSEARVDLNDERTAWHEAVAATGDALLELDGHLGLPGEWTMQISNAAGDGLFEIRIQTKRLSSSISRSSNVADESDHKADRLGAYSAGLQ